MIFQHSRGQCKKTCISRWQAVLLRRPLLPQPVDPRIANLVPSPVEREDFGDAFDYHSLYTQPAFLDGTRLFREACYWHSLSTRALQIWCLHRWHARILVTRLITTAYTLGLHFSMARAFFATPATGTACRPAHRKFGAFTSGTRGFWRRV